MFKDGYRIFKGKDNYEPCSEIFKGQYMVRPGWYVKNHLDNYRIDFLGTMEAVKTHINSYKEIRKVSWDNLKKTQQNDSELNSIKDEKEKSNQKAKKYAIETATIMQLQDVQNNSMVTSIFSCLEGYLWKICKEMEICLDNKVMLKHLTRNDFLKNYYDYLTTVVDLDHEPLKEAFNKISRQKFIRNRIIHNSNTIIDSGEEKNIQNIKGIKFYKNVYENISFHIEDIFLFELIDDVINLMEIVFKELEKRIFANVWLEPQKNGIIIEPQYPKNTRK
jgi:hypothetical protein